MAECRTALRLAVALSGGQGLTGLSVSGPDGTACFKGCVRPQLVSALALLIDVDLLVAAAAVDPA